MRVERLERFGFFGGLIIGCLVVGVFWLGSSGVFRTSSTKQIAAGYRDIASIQLQPVPEGPAMPRFVSNPKSVSDTPLALVRGVVPDPLPKPLDQPRRCDHGGDLVITLKDGQEITYGPCDYPWQISELWGAMIQTSHLTAPGGVPNTSAAAAQELVRRALAIALTRDQAGTKSHYSTAEISCAPAEAGKDDQPPGYICAATMRSESGAPSLKHLSVCASVIAGRLAYAPAPSNGGCSRTH